MKLALGTAQFGNNYGISNKNGIVSPNMAARILSLAIKNGVDTIDTAISYGEAENIIGKYCKRDVKIVTKLPELKKVNRLMMVIYGN